MPILQASGAIGTKGKTLSVDQVFTLGRGGKETILLSSITRVNVVQNGLTYSLDYPEKLIFYLPFSDENIGI